MKDLINDLRMYAEDASSVAGPRDLVTTLSLAADAIERMENEVVATTLQIENDSKIIDGLTRERMGLALDAARYRWLRDTTNWASNSSGDRIDVRNSPELWDSAIDEAIALKHQRDRL